MAAISGVQSNQCPWPKFKKAIWWFHWYNYHNFTVCRIPYTISQDLIHIWLFFTCNDEEIILVFGAYSSYKVILRMICMAMCVRIP